MANGLNKVQIIGNLGHTPELRHTQAGSAVTNVRVAVGGRRKEGDTWVDHTEWVSVVAFGRTAENIAKYIDKGRQVYFEGRLQTRKYTDKDGMEKWSTEVIAENMIFIGGGNRGDGKEQGKNVHVHVDDTDLPF